MRTPAPLWFITGLLFGFALSPLSYIALELHGRTEPTPAVQRADPGLAMGLAELASDEHRARIQAEHNLDELRREAQSVVAKLLSEIQRLQKRPTLKKGSIDS